VRLRWVALVLGIFSAFDAIVSSCVHAEIITLNTGVQLQGRLGKISSLNENPLSPKPSAGEVRVTQIVLVDDDLRRTFVPSKQIVPGGIAPDTPGGVERIKIEQRTTPGGRRIGSVGQMLRVTPFDEWGRRIVSMNTSQGKIDVIQGITEITPTYTKVGALKGFVWDMRIATSSIPRETLSKILRKQLEIQRQLDNPDARLKIVRLYIQSERYQDAQLELEEVLKEFPELAELQKQVQALRQVGAQRLIREIELRRDTGQHALALNMLANFPSEEVAGETLLKVRDMLGHYDSLRQQGERSLKLLEKHVAALADEKIKARLEPVRAEIAGELNFNTLDRMADYLRLADDEKLSTDQKLALAVSGWLLGSGSGTENLAVALSLADIRNRVRDYMRAERKHERDAILDQIEALEGATPSYLAKVIAHMKPPIETASQENEIPGLYELNTPGLIGEPDIGYYVQLPPEYDPYRRYPCIVTLCGAGTTPLQQIDWWAGSYGPQSKMRFGQASRHGYIVIAPKWTKEHQRQYEYSAREHATVLYSLRDAMRRFAIHVDKVFLSGHSMGGDAVWDIALAHPDQWAGVIPVVATADKYVVRYWENARDVPLYFVAGEMDGSKLSTNAPELDRYLTKVGYDCTVVVYQGRGHEHFYDEIQRIFDWMGLHQRTFFRREFKCVSMRPWDNYFWWAETDELPSRSLVVPASWPPASGVIPAATEGKILENNGLSLRTAAGKATVWLSPEMIDFSRRISINGRSTNVSPSIATLLEDVRTRGDRQHPFWAQVEVPK
jgi:predicted esterase